jgi:hypothetical protein
MGDLRSKDEMARLWEQDPLRGVDISREREQMRQLIQEVLSS